MKKMHIFGLILVIAMLFLSGCTSETPQNSQKQASGAGFQTQTKEYTCQDVQTPYETQEEYLKTEYYTETVPYTEKECETKKLVYSITDLKLDWTQCYNKEEVCHESVLILGCIKKSVYCTDRIVTCSIKLNNLDNEDGTWEIKFNFFKSGNWEKVEATNTVTYELYPQTSKEVSGQGKITTKELLESDYTCTYSVVNEPTKQVCHDVTKFKEVQKERQVTAYKPVTKYKTETKCG